VSTDVTLKAEPRTDFGKGAARTLRRKGLVPAVVYGSGSEVRHVVLPAHETNLALRIAQVVLRVQIGSDTFPVAPRDVQRDPVRTDLLHLDLVLLSRADVEERHAYNEAMQAAQANAEEAGLDPLQAAHVIEEAAAAGEDLAQAAATVVETLQEQARAFSAASAAAEAAEEAEEAAAAEGGEEAVGEEVEVEGESAE
jgi:large subunit ribosomal protein L25